MHFKFNETISFLRLYESPLTFTHLQALNKFSHAETTKLYPPSSLKRHVNQ